MVELVQPLTVARLTEDRNELGGMKAHLGIYFQITKEIQTPIVNDDGSTGFEKSFETQVITRWGPMTALPANASDEELTDYVATSCALIIEEAEKFTLRGSGHGIDRVLRFELKLDRWAPVRGASYLPSPRWIVSKKCCVNVRNDDQDCFRYALTAVIDRPAVNSERPAYYNTAERRALFDLSGIVMPAHCCADTFRRFERQNPGYALTIFECSTHSKGREDLQPIYMYTLVMRTALTTSRLSSCMTPRPVPTRSTPATTTSRSRVSRRSCAEGRKTRRPTVCAASS
jgi:hypothetical protein